ncbi:hypothetical protein Patl1_17092 [Pistacia atlantica]|uniref:Uncharacterized protein n=1 Tax=Pistacia atlantica TaxID=434234 RepID=A0ACC1B717_9ROSI|nr:hypothetical protein Patl1_17092 [Pistacia atlantica]
MDRKGTVRIASTNITENIVKILLREGFLENVRKLVETNKSFLVLTLRHRRNRKRPYRTSLNLKRISRPGLRIYSNYQRIPRILDGIRFRVVLDSNGPIKHYGLIFKKKADSIIKWARPKSFFKPNFEK